MTRGLQRPDIVAALALSAVSALTLAIVYASQYIGGLEPCELCLYQRWPWWGTLALGLLATLPVLSNNLRALLLAVAGLALLAGAGLAIYHTGIEQHWWPGPASCGAAGPIPGSFEQLQQMMQRRAPSCDQPAWTLFGISMAGYNAILSAIVGSWAVVIAVTALVGTEKVRPG